MNRKVKFVLRYLGVLGTAATLVLVLSGTGLAHSAIVESPPGESSASPPVQELPATRSSVPPTPLPEPNLVANMNVILQPGVTHSWVLGPSSTCGAYLVEVTPRHPSTDGAYVGGAVVRPEYSGDAWNDVLHLEIPADHPPLEVNLRVYQSCELQVASEFEATLSPGVWHGWGLGPCSMDRGFLVEITPLEPSNEGAYVRAQVQEEYFRERWLDVLRVQSSRDQPPVRVHIRVFTTEGMRVLDEHELVLETGVWTGIGLRPSSALGWYVIEINPHIPRAHDYVQRRSFQPEYNGESWHDVLRLQTRAGTPPMSIQARIYVWGEIPYRQWLPYVPLQESSSGSRQ